MSKNCSLVKGTKQWSLLIIVLLMLLAFVYFRLYEYVSYEFIKDNRNRLLEWRENNYGISIAIYLVVYITIVSISIPGATLLTVLGGFLYGPFVGGLLAILGATIGAFVIFLAVKLAFHEWAIQKFSKAAKKIELEIRKNAFYYMLFLRFVPIFPFWLVNVVPALLGVSKKVYVLSTFIGIIPATLVYAWIGEGLGVVIDENDQLNLGVIFNLNILLPLILLGLLSLVPVIYQRYKNTLNSK